MGKRKKQPESLDRHGQTPDGMRVLPAPVILGGSVVAPICTLVSTTITGREAPYASLATMAVGALLAVLSFLLGMRAHQHVSERNAVHRALAERSKNPELALALMTSADVASADWAQVTMSLVEKMHQPEFFGEEGAKVAGKDHAGIPCGLDEKDDLLAVNGFQRESLVEDTPTFRTRARLSAAHPQSGQSTA